MHLKYVRRQVRTEYKIDHQYTVLKRSVLTCAPKLFTFVIAQSSFGREFQSVGAATKKALSPNVVFDRKAGIERKNTTWRSKVL